MLRLAQGVRIAMASEIPLGNNLKNCRDIKIESASLCEGFYEKLVRNDVFEFTHYYEVNIDNDKLWNFFWKLADSIIEKNTYCIYGLKDEEYKFSPIVKKEKIQRILAEYQYSLVGDGYLAFGIASQNDKGFNEVLVETFKYIKIWTNNPTNVRTILTDFDIPETPNLTFVDELPCVSVSLANPAKGIEHANEVVHNLEQAFNFTE